MEPDQGGYRSWGGGEGGCYFARDYPLFGGVLLEAGPKFARVFPPIVHGGWGDHLRSMALPEDCINLGEGAPCAWVSEQLGGCLVVHPLNYG